MLLKILHAIFLMLLPGMGLIAQSPVPQQLELPRYQKSLPSQLISAKFYPIGFSQNGKFAYAIAPADEACGCYFFEFRIQDLVTDEVLFRYLYSSDKEPQTERYENISDLWAAKSAMFAQKMRHYQITRNIPAFDSSITDFQVQITKREFSEPGLSDTKFIRSARFEVQNSASGKKIVANLQFEKLYVKQLEAIGYYKNPYENRVALLITRIDRGWEGLPQVLNFEVIGVHQTKGFR